MSRRPEDTAGAAGRSVGRCPAPPALSGAARGLLSPGSASSSVRCPLGLCQPRGWSDGRRVRRSSCPGQEASRCWGFHLRLGGDALGVPGTGRAPAADTMGWQRRLCSSPSPCSGQDLSSPCCQV